MQFLNLSCQRHVTLIGLYQDWMDTVQTLLASRIAGTFKVASSLHQTAIRRQALQKYERLQLEVTRLRMQATKEKQLARQVELNLALRRVRASWPQRASSSDV